MPQGAIAHGAADEFVYIWERHNGLTRKILLYTNLFASSYISKLVDVEYSHDGRIIDLPILQCFSVISLAIYTFLLANTS